jgi:murein DD-endopeptidase MepM/ murein hydrolase activator NlpD
MKKVLFHLLLLFISAGTVRALEPPVQARITSDYGPRNVTSGTWFHEAIDYGADMWTPVEAVEDGVITEINYRPSDNGWYIKTSKGSGAGKRTWAYLHLSTDVAK